MAAMTVLMLGSGDFIGRATAAAVRARGVEAIAARRTPDRGDVALNRENPSAVLGVVRERRVTQVIDIRAMTEASTVPLLHALKGEVSRYVLVSSSDVYRNYGGLHRREAVQPILEPMAEDAPLRASRYPYRAEPPRAPEDPDAWLDAYDKIPIEEAVRASGLEHAVMRLPMVYGPGDKQRRFGWIVHRLLAGRTRMTVDQRWATWRSTYSYVEDVADALALAALHPAAANRTYNVGAESQPDHLGWIARISQALERPVQADAVDPARLSEAARRRFDAVDLSFPLRLDSAALRAELGWRERVDPVEALRRTAEDEAARGTPSGFDREVAAEDDVLEALA